MIRRHLAPVLRLEAARNPVVTLTGARQTGKTTLVRSEFPDLDYVSLERPDQRAAASSDPLGFLSRHSRGAILDEVQRVPELLSYIQVAVDEDSSPGRFILTGSQNILLMRDISQTLAGRTAVLHLHPLSLTELLGRDAIDVADPFALTDLPPQPPSLSVWEALWRGFYPRIHDRQLDPSRWLADYVRTYVERDLREVLNVMDLDGFERFVRLTAARTGTELNMSDLAADAGISQPTAKQWLMALRLGGLVTLLQPYHQNFRKRLRKRPKLHFMDSGLVCYLLGIHDSQKLETHPLRGAIFESFVVSEIMKAFEHRGREPGLFHWRDATGHEIDIVVELGQQVLPVEVKSGQTVAGDMLKTLAWWMELAGDIAPRGVLVHGGGERQTRKGIEVVPWHLG